MLKLCYAGYAAVCTAAFPIKSSILSEVENGVTVAKIQVLGWCSFRKVMTV